MNQEYPYFDNPTQVLFYNIDADDGNYTFGIAYHDTVICGCCGGVFMVDELYDFTPNGKTPIYPLKGWENLDEEIMTDGHDIEEYLEYCGDLSDYCSNLKSAEDQISLFDGMELS